MKTVNKAKALISIKTLKPYDDVSFILDELQPYLNDQCYESYEEYIERCLEFPQLLEACSDVGDGW